MNVLMHSDLQFALRRCPKALLYTLKTDAWADDAFVGGGFLRSVVGGEEVNDVDVFVRSSSHAEALALDIICQALYRTDRNGCTGEQFMAATKHLYKTDNAITVRSLKTPVQIIHRWVFPNLQAVSDSFDFTICCAAFGWTKPNKGEGAPGQWASFCDERFYPDLAAKRLVYRAPVRNEDAGGSMLRVLKYYQKGYRMPLDSLGAVISRLLRGVDESNTLFWEGRNLKELNHAPEGEVDKYRAKILTGLLREVDPNIDPNHIAHLPSESSAEEQLPE